MHDHDGAGPVTVQFNIRYGETPLTKEFLGKQLSGPFIIPSGIVTTAPAIFQRVMDTMPEVGVIATASIGFEPRLGNRELV